jgi:arabinofuranosyltransferase
MHSKAPEPPRRWPSWGPAALVAAAIALFVATNLRVSSPTDDAYIFYRYAVHLSGGHGLVYNVGERVEGFTSLLWTLLIAAGVAAGGDAVAVGHWLGVLTGALLLWLTYQYASFGLAAGERMAGAVSAWLLVLSAPFMVWSTAGLETPLFACAVTAALIADGRNRPALAVLVSAVAVLIRPEGLLLSGVVFAFAFRRGHPRRTLLALLGGYVAFLAVLTGFRLAYFGAPLPNTFYAKVGGTLRWWGAYYLLTFATTTLAPMIPPALYARRDRYLIPGACMLGSTLLYVLAVGGDAFPHSRFFVPVLPVLCAYSVRGAIIAGKSGGAGGRFAVLCLVACAIWFVLGTLAGVAAVVGAAFVSRFHAASVSRQALVAGASLLLVGWVMAIERKGKPVEAEGYEELNAQLLLRRGITAPLWTEVLEAREARRFLSSIGRQLAVTLDARPPPDKLVATLGIGSFGYYSKARVLDLVGLVDPTIARSPAAGSGDMAYPGHQRANTHYVLSRKPDYIVIPPRDAGFFRVPAVVELWSDAEFTRRYRWDPAVGGYRRV